MTLSAPDFIPPHAADAAMLARHRERWAAELSGPEDEAARALLDALFGNSPFLSDCAIREPEVVRDLFGVGPDATFAGIIERLEADPAVAGLDTPAVMRALRQARRRAALAIAAADIAGWWKLGAVTSALTRLADVTLSLATAHVMRRAAAMGDLPGTGLGYVVLALGKHGAGELNYSSDIDLIVLFDPDRLGYSGRRSPGEHCVTMTREITRMLSELTEDGYVFRVDLRLRPDPGAMPLAISIQAAETYYESVGQNWERAAMIKARPAAGDLALGEEFLGFARRFIWRKHLDFAAIRDIHSIKRQIDAHRGGSKIKVAGHNIKLGRGGIREIEFFAQTQQLIFGGREPALRSTRTLDALDALAEAGHISAEARDELTECYGFLRTLEHRLQMIDDRQTQIVPEDATKLAALAVFMGYAGLEGFDAALRTVLTSVERHYAALFEDSPSLGSAGNLVFTGEEDDPGTLETLRGMGFGEPARICQAVRGWHRGRINATRSARARELLTEIIPSLLQALSDNADPDQAFARLDQFLHGLPLGVPLFSLFQANPNLLKLLARIMGDAPRLADLLSRKPALFDAVLDRDFFVPTPTPAALEEGLETALSDVGEDYEAMLDAMRRWADEQRFRIGVLTLEGERDPHGSARALTHVADTVLQALVPRVEAEFARRHGHVPGPGMAVLALGRMGSGEMTAHSDLDLVIVYGGPASATSDGTAQLPAGTYYARLTQRLIAALTARTAEGVLYEVDLRLRPSGNAGPIATSLAAFRRYHKEEAWTWENMAMTRARIVTSPPGLRDAIAGVIRATLTARRDPDKLRADVADMRLRVAKEHRALSPWDVKYRPGGIVDIDFLAQYLALRHAADHRPILARGSAAILAHAQRLGLIEPAQAQAAMEALAVWTAVAQVGSHAFHGAFDPAEASPRLLARLATAAGAHDFKTLEALAELRGAAARAVYDALLSTNQEEQR